MLVCGELAKWSIYFGQNLRLKSAKISQPRHCRKTKVKPSGLAVLRKPMFMIYHLRHKCDPRIVCDDIGCR